MQDWEKKLSVHVSNFMYKETEKNKSGNSTTTVFKMVF
jgi:hypothetical protein